MQNLNLINCEKSDIKYSISMFPDGESQITLGEFSRKDDITVHCRITNAEELFILMQVIDILNRHEVYYDVTIYYLMGMRMDRVMDFNRPFTLKVIAEVLNKVPHDVMIVEPHSDNIYKFLGTKYYPETVEFKHDFGIELTEYQIVLPDKGAAIRYGGIGNYSKTPIIRCSKVRDEATGKLSGFKIENPEDIIDKPLLIIDDLCDGGGTFCGIAAELKKYNSDINIAVTHMVNNKGIQNLSKVFNHIWFTNSYCDWKSAYLAHDTDFPSNITQVDII